MHECDSSRDPQEGRDFGVENRSSRRTTAGVDGFSGWPSPPLPSRPQTFSPGSADFTIHHAPSAPAAIFQSVHVLHPREAGGGAAQQLNAAVECRNKDAFHPHMQHEVEDGGFAVDPGGRDIDSSNARAQRCQVWFRPVNGVSLDCSHNEGNFFGESLYHANSFPLARAHGRPQAPTGARSEAAVEKRHHESITNVPTKVNVSPKETGRRANVQKVDETRYDATRQPRKSTILNTSDELLEKGLLLEHEALHPDDYSDTQVGLGIKNVSLYVVPPDCVQ